MTAFTPRRRGPFAAQSRDDPEPYSAPRGRRAGRPRPGSASTPRRWSSPRRSGGGPSTCPRSRDEISEPHVGERPSHHDLVVSAREPYELNSRCSTPRSTRYRPPGLSRLIEPAGEMWSVVTLSPTMTRQRAPVTSSTRPGASAPTSKYGGRRMYVEPSSQAKSSPSGNRERAPTLVAREHVGVRPPEHVLLHRRGDRLPHLFVGRPEVAEEGVAPSRSLPSGSLVRSRRSVRRARRRRRAAVTPGSSP